MPVWTKKNNVMVLPVIFLKPFSVTRLYIFTFTPRRPMEYIATLPTPQYENKAVGYDGKGWIYPKKQMPGI